MCLEKEKMGSATSIIYDIKPVKQNYYLKYFLKNLFFLTTKLLSSPKL